MMRLPVAATTAPAAFLWVPPPSPLAAISRSAPILLQAGADDEEDEDDAEEAFLEQIEQAFSGEGSRPSVDPGLRIQRALERARGSGGGPLFPARGEARTNQPRRFTRESTQLFRLPGTLKGAYDDFLERPGRPLVLGALALLVGFYLAGSLSTIFGAAGFWEPTIAIGPLVVTELITRRYYSRPLEERSQTIRLLNAMKCGFYLGIVIDALKLAG